MTDTSDHDDVIYVSTRGFRLRASDARALTKATGRTLTELLTGDDLADQIQAMVFIELRKRERADLEGKTPTAELYRDPAETWAMAEDVDVEMEMPGEGPRPDPLSATSY